MTVTRIFELDRSSICGGSRVVQFIYNNREFEGAILSDSCGFRVSNKCYEVIGDDLKRVRLSETTRDKLLNEAVYLIRKEKLNMETI